MGLVAGTVGFVCSFKVCNILLMGCCVSYFITAL